MGPLRRFSLRLRGGYLASIVPQSVGATADYESPALTVELQALQWLTDKCCDSLTDTVAVAVDVSLGYDDDAVSAIRMMVKASTPDSPSLVGIVWRSGCSTKSAVVLCDGKVGAPRVPTELTGPLVRQSISTDTLSHHIGQSRRHRMTHSRRLFSP